MFFKKPVVKPLPVSEVFDFKSDLILHEKKSQYKKEIPPPWLSALVNDTFEKSDLSITVKRVTLAMRRNGSFMLLSTGVMSSLDDFMGHTLVFTVSGGSLRFGSVILRKDPFTPIFQEFFSLSGLASSVYPAIASFGFIDFLIVDKAFKITDHVLFSYIEWKTIFPDSQEEPIFYTSSLLLSDLRILDF